MRIRNMVAAVSALALSAACLFGAAGCSGSSDVAAKVNGVEIKEATITNDIQSYRTAYGMSDEQTWAEFLSYYGYTPESIREEMINSYVQQEIVKEQAEKEGIVIEDSEVDAYVNQIKANYESEEAWQKALESAGFTEQDYRENAVKLSLQKEALMNKVTPLTEATDDEILSYVGMYAQYSFKDSKKSSHILFASSDKETAEKVLADIKAGKISFEDAAAQYSLDSSGTSGGNVGWDCLSTFVDEYQTALNDLSVGQVSDLVTSQYGIHIIKCTEVFTCPEEITSVDQVPAEMVSYVRSQFSASNQSTNFNTWLQEKVSEADVTINDMPKGLPYDVDMSKYATSNTSNTNTTEATNTTNTNGAENAATNENSSANNANANSNGNTNNTSGSSN